jgi:hypothetical protein
MSKYSDIIGDIELKLASAYSVDGGITAERHQYIEKAILDLAETNWRIGDIKEVDCTDDYITQNFDGNGIGIVGKEREGWAICNGYNALTRNRTGRVSVAYGKVTPIDSAPQFTSVGSAINAPVTGGAKDAVIVSHTHTSTSSVVDTYREISKSGTGSHSVNSPGNVITANEVGVDGTNKNMQPYIVTLFIQKIS